MSLRPRKSVFQVDTEALYVRLDKRRRTERMSWRAVGRETGITISTLSRIAHGHQIHGDALVTLMAWADLTDITELTRTRPVDDEEPPR
jgi:transcriptional regulator with XRE-family HTH domain